MIEHRVKASEEAVKRQIGKDNNLTINRYLGATNLQEVADTFMYGNYDSSVLDDAISKAKENKLDDQVVLLEKFYPFTVESNAVEPAIDKATESMPEEVRDGNKRYLGAIMQNIMNSLLQDTTDSTGFISDTLEAEIDNIIDSLPTSEDVVRNASLISALTFIANELKKASTAAATPTTKLDSVEKPKETTPATASEEAKEEEKPTSGDSPKPTGTIKPDSDEGILTFDPEEFDKPEEEPEGTAGTTPAIEPAPETSEPSITDNLLKATERTTSQKELDDILRTATESHDEKLISDDDLTRITGAVNNKKLLTTDPVPNPLSPTGGNEQDTQVTPNREESKPEETDSPKKQAEDMLRSVGKQMMDAMTTSSNLEELSALVELGEEAIKQATEAGVDKSLVNNIAGILAGLRTKRNAIQDASDTELTVAEVGIVRRTETPEEKEKREKDRSFAGVSYQKYANSINWRGENRGVAKPKSTDSDYNRLRDLLAQYGIDYEHVVNNYLYEMLDEKGRLGYSIWLCVTLIMR
jgi:hypothetical protein